LAKTKEQRREARDQISSASETDSEEETSEIKFPKDNAADLLQFIQRDLNNLGDSENNQTRKFALIKLYEIFVLAKEKAPCTIY
jgi:hypothetical protein